MVGAFLAGCFSDRLGRLTVIGTGVAIFTVGATLLTAAVNIPMLYVGRLVSGIGCGAVANNTPLYLSEISPAHRRGRYTSLSNVMEDLGFALIAWVSFAFSYVAGQTSWRLIFACQYVGSVILMYGVYVLPSSPRWLALKDRGEDSLKVLANLHGASPGWESKKEGFASLTGLQLMATSRIRWCASRPLRSTTRCKRNMPWPARAAGWSCSARAQTSGGLLWLWSCLEFNSLRGSTQSRIVSPCRVLCLGL